MAVLGSSKTVSLNDGVLSFLRSGHYEFEFGKKNIQIDREDGQVTNLSSSQFADIEEIVIGQDTTVTIGAGSLGLIDLDFQGNGAVNLTGVTFTGADMAADGKFEPSQDLDTIVSELIEERGVNGALDALQVNGNQEDAFRVVWDHLDDNYFYYNTEINDAFIDLGIAYATHLREGGARLLDIAKFAPDSSDAGTTPDRMQSLHDNILGNFDEASIMDKFGGNAGAIIDRIQDAGLGATLGVIGDYTDGRGVYSGSDDHDPTRQRTFDASFFG
ncbi:hypothetical protein [Azospirillum sp. SYSU D00513]|uniref:hypothetical protein n=1 Tax=Azospirillum sp. SYSU D00513 TaxID=2812561 RepID=UPI001A9697D9|nr:hypothetical protein [Azospirillum sp. SYSU D00513]